MRESLRDIPGVGGGGGLGASWRRGGLGHCACAGCGSRIREFFNIGKVGSGMPLMGAVGGEDAFLAA
jgi:hypothetical protein